MAGTTKRPFWMHQLVEYILGGAMVAAGLQSPTPLVPSVVGAVIMLNAAITIGPMGAFRVISRGVHRVFDVAVIALEVVAGFQPWIDLESGTRFIVVGIALVHVGICSYWALLLRQQTVREACNDHGALLIFDEVISGFRVAPGGAQRHIGRDQVAVFDHALERTELGAVGQFAGGCAGRGDLGGDGI